MLATLKEVLAFAKEHNCAIGAFNTPTLETLDAVIEATEGNVTVVPHALQGSEALTVQLLQGWDCAVKFAEAFLLSIKLFRQLFLLLCKRDCVIDVATHVAQFNIASIHAIKVFTQSGKLYRLRQSRLAVLNPEIQGANAESQRFGVGCPCAQRPLAGGDFLAQGLYTTVFVADIGGQSILGDESTHGGRFLAPAVSAGLGIFP